MQTNGSLALETVESNNNDNVFDDDGRLKRQGTLLTASAHIITAVIGSGVLSLAWSIAQLGWIAGVAALAIFALVTLYTSSLLTNFYRFPDPTNGTRNYSYMQSVKNSLGGLRYRFCGIALYANLVGTGIGYSVTAGLSMGAMQRSNCFHKYGHNAPCRSMNEIYIILFGIIQIILSQLPNFHKLSGLSIIAAIMSFTYSFIGLGLSIGKIAEGKHPNTSLTGTIVGVDVTKQQKIWNSFKAIGDIAFAYAYSQVLLDIEDTLKSSPPEHKVMKRATAVGVSVTTLFYMLCGCLGYLAFGQNAPGNFLTGFGFYEPFWLVDFANACIVVHLVGAYQVFSQPFYKLVEEWSSNRWPQCDFVVKDYPINIPFVGTYQLNLFRFTWRTIYVVFTTTLAIIFPFFNEICGLLGALVFWPLTVYFPIEMHIEQTKIPSRSSKWFWLKLLSGACFFVSLFAAAGSIQGIVKALQAYKPFQFA